MCRPDHNRQNFFARGAAKGWPESRIQRAWDAHQAQSAREDARAILKAPDPPKQLEVGEKVLSPGDRSPGSAGWEIGAIRNGYAWLLDPIDKGIIRALCRLERVNG